MPEPEISWGNFKSDQIAKIIYQKTGGFPGANVVLFASYLCCRPEAFPAICERFPDGSGEAILDEFVKCGRSIRVFIQRCEENFPN